MKGHERSEDAVLNRIVKKIVGPAGWQGPHPSIIGEIIEQKHGRQIEGKCAHKCTRVSLDKASLPVYKE